MPASPALAAASIVRGPIEGMSTRRSLSGLGRLDQDAGAAHAASHRGDSRQHLVGAFRPSIASTRFPATTAAWPTSNGDSH
jgi:hypothetical protein